MWTWDTAALLGHYQEGSQRLGTELFTWDVFWWGRVHGYNYKHPGNASSSAQPLICSGHGWFSRITDRQAVVMRRLTSRLWSWESWQPCSLWSWESWQPFCGHGKVDSQALIMGKLTSRLLSWESWQPGCDHGKADIQATVMGKLAAMFRQDWCSEDCFNNPLKGAMLGSKWNLIGVSSDIWSAFVSTRYMSGREEPGGHPEHCCVNLMIVFEGACIADISPGWLCDRVYPSCGPNQHAKRAAHARFCITTHLWTKTLI